MAVKQVLASDLITEDSIGLFEERARRRLRAGTGCCASVDDALDGGLVYGQDGIYNISGATGSRAAESVCPFLMHLFHKISEFLLSDKVQDGVETQLHDKVTLACFEFMNIFILL